MKILIIGDARHGKDTVANLICKRLKLKLLSSSIAALDIFLFDVLNKKYNKNYLNKKDAFYDRINNREIWYEEICEYNKNDKTKLIRKILEKADIYIGLRSKKEVEKCVEENIFDLIIGIFNNRLKKESYRSKDIDIFKYSDLIIINNGTLDELESKIFKIFKK